MIEDSAAAELTVGRSMVRRRILALLMSEPDQRLHLREIQRRVRTSPGTASRELARLVAAGLADRQAEGHQVYFKSTSSPLATMLRTLMVAPAPVPAEVESVPASGAAVATASAVATAPAVAAVLSPEPPTPDRADLEGPQARPSRTPRTMRAAGQAQQISAGPDALGLEVAGRLAQVLRPLYAGRLAGIFLYGARARGDAGGETDVEVVVVLDAIDRYGDELERTSTTCAGLSLEFGLVVSRLFVSESTWQGRTDGHLPAIRSEAVPV